MPTAKFLAGGLETEIRLSTMTSSHQNKHLQNHDCICAWSDLLGFGTSLRAGGWNDIETVQSTLDRVVRLHDLAVSSFCDFETMFMINDGIARNFDFCPDRGLFRIINWLRGLWETHDRINQLEQESGHPGIRTVLTYGKRATYSEGNWKTSELMLANRPNLSHEDLSFMYHDKFLSKTIIYVPVEFQMNLAFAKAYFLESLGSRHGLPGPRFFIDNSLVDFLLTSLNGTLFQFHSINDIAAKTPVHVKNIEGETYRAIQFWVPDLFGVYKHIAFIAVDPNPIENEYSTLWAVRRIAYSTSSNCKNMPDETLYGC